MTAHMTPADELRATAAKVRELGKAALPYYGPPCRVEHDDSLPQEYGPSWELLTDNADGEPYTIAAYRVQLAAEWAAAMSPAIAEPLADLLDVMRQIAEYAHDRGYRTNQQTEAALRLARVVRAAVARTISPTVGGESSTTPSPSVS